MGCEWNLLVDRTGLVSLFALATQCALAWVAAGLFLALHRSADFFRPWTRAWFARAVALLAVLVYFVLATVRPDDPDLQHGTSSATTAYVVYQGGKLLSVWWLVLGVLHLVPVAPGRKVELTLEAALLALAGLSAWLSTDVEKLLVVQAVITAPASALAGVLLFRLARERRTLGTRLSGLVLCAQGFLWSLYLLAFLQSGRGIWPDVRTIWTALAAHNSFFDLAIDVLLGSSLLVLLFQELQRRQRLAEQERTRLQTELNRMEKLRSLETLVSGVAHELNNPLSAILGFAEALGGAPSEPERARAVTVIREQALRCRRIVRGLATFSGEKTDVPERIDLGELLGRVARGFEFELARHRIELEISAPPDLPRISAQGFALEQLFTNLIANALQASPAEGTVTVLAGLSEGALEVEILDRGPGLTADVLERAFDPFFTTKQPGQGMGLGLAVAHGIARAHGGSIRAENRPGGGARLRVSLPLSGREPAPPEPPALSAREIPRPQAPGLALDLLVIDDEPALCELLQRFGHLRGWSVITAGSGRDGLARLRAEGARFHAVLCDLRMAPPSGIEIHDVLLHEEPELLERFLFLTGDLSSEEAAAFSARCKRPVLRKPFELGALAAQIEELASERPGRPAVRSA
jgi:signal transduction histidine kinase/CheY-like chemotaxis protein